ncbi:MAG: hypothetical protein WCQ60_02990 [bacterium]
MTKKYVIMIVLFFIGAVSVSGVYVWHWEMRPNVLEVYPMLSDTVISTFIRTPDNHTILIDGGKTNGIMRLLTSHMPFYRRNIDTIVLTKNDDAHVGGLVDVVNRYHVGQVIEMVDMFTGPDSVSKLARLASTSTAYLELEKIIHDKKILNKKVAAGDTLLFEESVYGRVVGNIIFPPATTTRFIFSKTNMPQLALRIRYGGTSFLVGDLSKTEQKSIASTSLSTNIVANVLIFQHAGGSNTVAENFFTLVHPDYVVISKKQAAAQVSIVKKPKKPPFSIFNVSALHIINLATDGTVEFISDGAKVMRK